MNRTFVFTIIILWNATCWAFQTESDSIKSLLSGHEKRDTIRVNLLIQLAEESAYEDPEKAAALADSAIALSENIQNEKKLASSYKVKGFVLKAGGEIDKAIDAYQEALRLFVKQNNRLSMGIVHNNIGNCYSGISSYRKAVEHHTAAVKLFEELSDSLRLPHAINSLAVDYNNVSDYNRSLECYLRALSIFESRKKEDPDGLANTLTNISILYRNLSLFKPALSYVFRALRVNEQAGNEPGIANACNTLGNIYDDMDSSDKALACYAKALAINRTHNNLLGLYSNYTNMGVIYSARGNYSQAWNYLKEAYTYYENTNDKNNLCVALNELGKICTLATDSFLENRKIAPARRFDEALTYLTRSLSIAKEINSIIRQVSVYAELIKTYENKKDFKKAFQASKQFIQLHDSILSDEKKSEITKKEVQFEFEKKEALLKAEHEHKQTMASAEINRQRVIKNASMAGGSVLLVAGAFSFFFYKRKRDAEKEKSESDFKVQVSDTEMKALRAQMNPHFIFNSLNSISDFILRNDTKAADNYLTGFAKLMRMILENSEKKEVSIEKDLQALELYMKLESFRLNGKFTYEISVDSDIDKENTLIPPLILQPFVENSIWHGIAKKQGTGKITIRIIKEDGMINCIVEDNGIGRKKSEEGKSGSTQSEKKSLGMIITNARIDIINRIKKSKAGVKISDPDEGLRVEVKLPLELSF